MRKAIQDAKLPYTYVVAYGAGWVLALPPCLASDCFGRSPFCGSADSCMTGKVAHTRALRKARDLMPRARPSAFAPQAMRGAGHKK